MGYVMDVIATYLKFAVNGNKIATVESGFARFYGCYIYVRRVKKRENARPWECYHSRAFVYRPLALDEDEIKKGLGKTGQPYRDKAVVDDVFAFSPF